MNLNATVVLQAHEAEQVRSIVEHLASRKSNDIIAASIRTKFPIERNNGTKNTYKGVHREFQQWCDQKYNGDMNAGIVSETKTLLFLQERVVGRQSRKRRRGTESQTIGVKSVLNAVSAIVDLWKRQSYLNVNM